MSLRAGVPRPKSDGATSVRWLIRLYRDDSVTTVEYDNVKHAFWMADNTVLCIARYADDGSHYYIHWLREHVAWFTAERQVQ